MTDYKAARARVEAALKMADRYDAGGMSFGESDDGHLKFDDLRTILAGPPVTVEEVARVIEPDCWQHLDEIAKALCLPDLTDEQAQRLRKARDDRFANDSGIGRAQAILALFHKDPRP